MTELQLGLIGLGGALVAGVMAYNTWQEYRHRKIARQLLDETHPDVLLARSPEAADPEAETEARVAPDTAPMYVDVPPDEREPSIGSAPEIHGERVEPVLYVDLPPANPAPDEAVVSTAGQSEPGNVPGLAPESETAPEMTPTPPADPAPASVPEPAARAPWGGTQPAAPVPSAPVSAPTPSAAAPAAPSGEAEGGEAGEADHLLSPAIDYIVALEAVEPAPAYQILESQNDALLRVKKPIHWIGYNETAREWEPIVDDGQSEYRRIRAGLQLVDRRGPLSESELSTFHLALQALSDELMAIPELPPRQPALDAAIALDQFCASVDIQIGINVIASAQVFPGTKLRALAEAAGMVIDADGRFVRCDDEGNVLYLLLNQANVGFSPESMKTLTTHGVTFLLDVPRVSHGERVFSQMVDLAKRFADVLRGTLVDDNRRPLSDGALEPIRQQIGQYQSMMAARRLPAGGPLAQRLFS